MYTTTSTHQFIIPSFLCRRKGRNGNLSSYLLFLRQYHFYEKLIPSLSQSHTHDSHVLANSLKSDNGDNGIRINLFWDCVDFCTLIPDSDWLQFIPCQKRSHVAKEKRESGRKSDSSQQWSNSKGKTNLACVIMHMWKRSAAIMKCACVCARFHSVLATANVTSNLDLTVFYFIIGSTLLRLASGGNMLIAVVSMWPVAGYGWSWKMEGRRKLFWWLFSSLAFNQCLVKRWQKRACPPSGSFHFTALLRGNPNKLGYFLSSCDLKMCQITD